MVVPAWIPFVTERAILIARLLGNCPEGITMTQNREGKQPSLSVKSLGLMALAVGAVSLGIVAIQQSDWIKLRPASGTASAMAAASDQHTGTKP